MAVSRKLVVECLAEIQKGFCNRLGCFSNFSNSEMHIDRIMPGAMGGIYHTGHVHLLCRGCNIEKGAEFWPDCYYKIPPHRMEEKLVACLNRKNEQTYTPALEPRGKHRIRE